MKLSLFTDEMILNIKNPQKPTQTTRSNKWIQQSCMINTKISGMLYTSNEQSEKEIKKTISLVIVSRIKYLAINLT